MNISAGKKQIMIAVAVALLLSGVMYKWQGRVGLNIADEGFLWYGVQQTAKGAVAIRDFNAYDPGRYEWCALGSHVFGDGFRGVRKSSALFQAVCFTFGLLLLRRIYDDWWLTVIAGLSVFVLFHPQYKVFEAAWSLVFLYAGVHLVEKPGVRMHFITGVAVGLGAFIGRNVGLYGLLGFVALAVYLQSEGRARGSFFQRASALAIGVLLGYSPMLYMLAVNPGMFDAFVGSIADLVFNKSTNIGKPVPWPWTPEGGRLGASSIMLGIIFMLMPVYYLVIWALHIARKWRVENTAQALVTVSAAIGLPFMHHAFARPDVEHMANAGEPFVVGLLALPIAIGIVKSRAAKAAFASAVLLVFSITVGVHYPGFLKMMFKDITVSVDMKGERGDVFIWNLPAIEYALKLDKRIPEDEMLFIAPHQTSLYAMLRRTSPIKEIYLLLKVTDQRQREIADELGRKNVNWALIFETKVDEREDMMFRNLYPIIYGYITENFERVDDKDLPEDAVLFKRRQG